MLPPGAAQAQTLGPLPDFSIWQIVDIPFLFLNAFIIAMFIAVALIVRRRYARFFKIQREALDHRKVADAQVLAQNQSIEQVIARQYGVVNAHNQVALSRAEEALRISTDILAQITTMNQSIARIADRLDHAGGPAA
jgi:hypothetical protein